MVKHSPHRRWRGCCQLCKAHKNRCQGDAEITPFRVLRTLGKRRKFRRNWMGNDDA